MKKYSTVVFDLDGTLLNTLEDLADAVNYVLRKFGWEEHTIDRVRLEMELRSLWSVPYLMA